MAPLTFEELKAILRGEQPLPANRALSFTLPLTAAQAQELGKLLVEGLQSDEDDETAGPRLLKLRGCRLDDDAAEDLSRAIAFNCSLRVLDLRDNEISDTGALYLANALRNHNHTLLALDLTGNPCIIENPETLQEIAMLLARNEQEQSRGGTPATSPQRVARALVRFEEMPPDTPVGRTRLTLSDAEVEHRFQELTAMVEVGAAEAAELRDMGAGLATYRATLDVASQQASRHACTCFPCCAA